MCGWVNVLKVSNLVPQSASEVMLHLSRSYLLQTTREVIGNINRGYGSELVHSVHQNIRLAILAKHSFYLQQI